MAEVLSIADLADRLAAVERRLAEALGHGNRELIDPGMRVVRGGGKRIRPALSIAAAMCNGAWDDRVVAGAVSVELVHVGSLVHDDIMDEAKERRGVPTVSFVEGRDQAILVGDYLLACAGIEAAKVSKEVAGALAQGIADLCDGQSREINDAFNVDRTLDAFEQSIAGKTAALMRTSAQVGGLAGGFGPAEVAALAAYGEAFGMAFQLVDDVLDLLSSAGQIGKPVLKDIVQGVYTLPVIDFLSTEQGASFKDLLRARPEEPQVILDIRDAVLSSGAIDRCLERADDYGRLAVGALGGVPSSAARDGLARLPQAYVDWALSTKAVRSRIEA